MKDKLLKYNRQVPRYTSYPSAPHFAPMGAEDYAQSLRRVPPDDSVSLYVHIPFCREMCRYCGCHTSATRKYAPVSEYVTLLLKELALLADTLGCIHNISHVHFGGGSPSMLEADDFSRIMDGIAGVFAIRTGAEIAIETDPRGITADRVRAYRTAGVNRASFGIQDFSPHVQKAINRVQDFDVVQRSVGLFRDHGIDRINFDLMYGLPLQTVGDVQKTAALSMSLQPDRVAVFGYAHVPWMKKHMRLIRDDDLPSADARVDQFAAAEAVLTAQGLKPVGLDHFVTENDDMYRSFAARRLTRNFQGYTTDTAKTMLGLGVSSIGLSDTGFFQNAANITEYAEAVNKGALPTKRGYVLTDEDRVRAHIISDLMCYLTVDVGSILGLYNRRVDSFDAVLTQLPELAADGILTVQGRTVTVNSAARQAVRVVCSLFDAHFTEGVKKHTQAA